MTTALDLASRLGIKCNGCIQEALYSVGLYSLSVFDKVPSDKHRQVTEQIRVWDAECPDRRETNS